MEKPVFIINGFLEAGKTSFIKTTLMDPGFLEGDRILIICCEEGEEEYDGRYCAKNNISIVTVEDMEELTEAKFREWDAKYRPQKILFELNGMWKIEEFLEIYMPKDWVFAQIITIIDASTFSNYLANMRQIMMEQIKLSDTILFNRCEKGMKKGDFRRSVKLVNRNAQIIYENIDGTDDDGNDESDLPFDVSAPVIEIEEDDFGLWYMDAFDNVARYEGKTVYFKGMVYKDKKMPRHCFVPGRFAMTCCVNDIAFFGFYCVLDKELEKKMDSIDNRSFVMVKAVVKYEFQAQYKGKGPMLYALEIEETNPPKEEVVTFN